VIAAKRFSSWKIIGLNRVVLCRFSESVSPGVFAEYKGATVAGGIFNYTFPGRKGRDTKSVHTQSKAVMLGGFLWNKNLLLVV